MSTLPIRPDEHAPKKPLRAPRATTGKPFKTTLVNHRDCAKAFGVSIPCLLRWMRRGEFPAAHSTLGTFYLFDRSVIEYRLEKGLWPAGTKFSGAGRRPPNEP